MFRKILIALLPVTTLWGALALAFGDSNSDNLNLVLAALFGMLGLLTLIGLVWRCWQIRILSTEYPASDHCFTHRMVITNNSWHHP